MKNSRVGAFALASLVVLGVGAGCAYACPLFVKFFPDPKDVPDQEGEFVEILLDETGADSLWVQMDEKSPLVFEYPRGTHLVLVHDSDYCPSAPDYSCELLGKWNLPNSRESTWRLKAGSCEDSVLLPRPKAGHAFQRVGKLDSFELVAPTFEIAELTDSIAEAPVGVNFLTISEVHHCPQEPEPEWVEVYNNSGIALPLEKFGFCNRGGSWGGEGRPDSIAPYESILLTRDSAGLRQVLGFKDVRIIQESMGYLNNSSGCISVCSGETVIDSVCWDRHTVTCPAGFNPLTMKAENTPGFVRMGSSSKGSAEAKAGMPFSYRLSSRVLRLGGNPFRVYVESDYQVQIRLLDSAGRDVWRMDAPACSNAWWYVPLNHLTVGVAYVSFSVGKFENLVGILIRP